MTAGAFGWAVASRCSVTGKVRFGPSAADEKVRLMALNDPYARILSAYRCRFCDWWHVGHDWRNK